MEIRPGTKNSLILKKKKRSARLRSLMAKKKILVERGGSSAWRRRIGGLGKGRGPGEAPYPLN